MSLPMYDASIPVLERALHNLKHILRKAEEHADAAGFDASVLLQARLFPDMFPLSVQVVIASDIAKACGYRLAGEDVPSYPDDAPSFEALHARIDKVLVALREAKPDAINGSEDRDITLKIRGNDVHFKGQTYLQFFVMPNVYFHVTTAYNILRHNGVPLGKMDFLGSA